MKATRFFAMAAAAVALAACSSDELASVEQQPAARDMKPVEFATAVNHQTRAGQIEALTTYWVQTTGTFYRANGVGLTAPLLTVGSDGSYKVNDDAEASRLYWPVGGTDATFKAWYYEGGAGKGALDNRTATLDAVGAYAEHAQSDNPTSVGLDFKHAVSKAVFKAKMHEAAADTKKVKVDIKAVALRSMKYAATAYAAPSTEQTMGAFAVSDDKRDLISPADIDLTADASWITEAADAATDLQMPMFVMPQAIAAADIQDLSADGDWTGAYISVLAQVRLDEADDAVIFPRGSGTDKYAWIALPLPADFTGFTAHKKYVFTLNFRNDAMGLVDKDQNPNDDGDPTTDDTPSGPDTNDEIDDETSGGNITLPEHSGIPLEVTVDEVLDFDEEGSEFDVNNVTAAAPAGTDLSMVDCAGNARANMSTANCYMVHTAGDYKLPLVYGNAIKNGAANTLAYNPGGTASETFSTNFVNHADQAITAPWIKDNGITVTQAELLWQDAQGLITAVDINGDYLTLTVGKDAATQEGNALIAAKDAEGTIVWSWHIWVTKQTFNDLTEFAAEVTFTTPNTSYTYQLTPVNLGWVGDATSTTGYCTFYQWGRKDAFIPGTGEDTTNQTVYDISNAPVSGFSHTDDNSVTIGGNIQHPTVHNYNSETDGPCNTRYYNMWDAQQTSDDIAAAATVKTVYDPCPPGFCVPTSGLYYYIQKQTRPEFNKGCTYSGVFFPASGGRYYNSGALNNVGSGGYCWSADGYTFYFDSSRWGLYSDCHANGYPVRAVAE